MAAYRLGGKGPFRIGPKRLPGGIEIGRISTGTKDKRLADAMERCVEDLAVQGWGDLVARLGHDLRLPDLYAAKIMGPKALQELRDLKADPPLAEVLERARSFIADDRARNGIGQLERYLEEMGRRSVRFSWLRKPANLNELYSHARATGLPPNSIRRSLHRAVCEILSHELGRGQMLAVMADVKKPSADDERTVDLTPKQIQALLEQLDEEVRPVIELALLTGIDLTPLLRLRPMDFDPETGTVQVDDRKAPSRARSVPVPPAAEAIIRRLSAGREEEERLFGLTRWQVSRRFYAARKAAKLDHVRIKDLRGVFATSYLRAGGSVKDLISILGHSGPTMAIRYLRRIPARQRKEMEAAAEKMGLGVRHMLKVERGGGE